MATLPDLVLQLIDASWQLSIAFLPLLYFGFLGHALGVEQRESLLETVVWSQRSYTVHYGVYTTAGLIAGGVPVLALDGVTGLVVGGAVAAAACLYKHMKDSVPEADGLDLDTWRDRVQVAWLLVPLLAAAAVLTANPMLKSLTALVFLTAVFWTV